jgi:AbiV family abortive infection protein
MGNKHLQPYRGPLSAAEIAEGMNMASENGRRLRDDARQLFESGRYPSALALAILSIEESGKVRILRQLALCRSPKTLRSTWKEYTTHTAKNRLWSFPGMAIAGARRLEDFLEIFEDRSENPKLLDGLKQLAVYTDCLGNKQWSNPATIISEEVTDGVLRVADLLCVDREFTQREIELWIEHIAPVWGLSMTNMKHGIMAWHRAMVDEGLREEDEEFITEFLFGEGDGWSSFEDDKQEPL